MISTPIIGSIQKWNTVLDTSHGIPNVLDVSSTGFEMMSNSSSNMHSRSFIRQSTTLSSLRCTCCNTCSSSIVRGILYLRYLQSRICYTCDYLRAYSKLHVHVVHVSAQLKLVVSFTSQTARRFKLANIKRIKRKRISIMCAWLLMSIDNE